MKLLTLNQNESAGKLFATHVAIVTAADISGTDPTCVVPLLTVANKMAVKVTHTEVKVPFKDASDALVVTTTLAVGDGSDPNRLLVEQEVNENGTEVYVKSGVEALYQYTGDDTVDATFAVDDDPAVEVGVIDVGEVHIYLQVVDGRVVA